MTFTGLTIEDLEAMPDDGRRCALDGAAHRRTAEGPVVDAVEPVALRIDVAALADPA